MGDFPLFKKEVVGLKSNEEKCERRLRIDNAKYCLLLEQECQWDKEEDKNPKLLARIYWESTRDLVQVAQDGGPTPL
jgi:hypothetical protein